MWEEVVSGYILKECGMHEGESRVIARWWPKGWKNRVDSSITGKSERKANVGE